MFSLLIIIVVLSFFFSNNKFLFPLLIKFISFLNIHISEEGILKTYFLINYGPRLSSFVFFMKVM